VCNTAFAGKASYDCDRRELFRVEFDSTFSSTQN
jgi:hypothetical protein